MSLLDALIYGLRDVFRGSETSPMPRTERIRFSGAVTYNELTRTLEVDTGAGEGIDTLLGDGTDTNASHIIGDRIEWEPIDVPGLYVGELAGKVDTDGDATPTSIVLFTPDDLTGYAIDVTATAFRPDGVWEKWKLTCSVGRVDSAAGLTKSTDTAFSDTSDDSATLLDTGDGSGIAIVIDGGDIVLQLADDVGGPYGWTYAARVQRDTRS